MSRSGLLKLVTLPWLAAALVLLVVTQCVLVAALGPY